MHLREKCLIQDSELMHGFITSLKLNKIINHEIFTIQKFRSKITLLSHELIKNILFLFFQYNCLDTEKRGACFLLRNTHKNDNFALDYKINVSRKFTNYLINNVH